MRFTGILPIALAVAPAVVSAAGTLGYSLGDKKPDGTCKSTTDYETDFDSMKGTSTLVRTYSSSDCNTAQNIIPACKSKGFKVILGVWYVHYYSLTPLERFAQLLSTLLTDLSS